MVTIDQSTQIGKFYQVIDSTGEKQKFPEDIVFEYSIFTGKKFSEDLWKDIQNKTSGYSCYSQLLRFLSVKPYTESEMRKKLKKKGFSLELILETLEKAKRMKLINDLSIVKQFIREQIEFGRFGRNRIILKLQQRGIAPELIRKHIDQLYSERPEENLELLNALKIGNGKLRLLEREEDYSRKKDKLLRFLANRGFSMGICYDAANRLMSENSLSPRL